LTLEEIKALSGPTEVVDPDHLEKSLQQQPPAVNAKELAKPPNAIRSASFLMQYLLLMQRILICAKRNYVSIRKKNKTKKYSQLTLSRTII